MQFLSPKELAQAVGVSESSLKRWADEGLLEVSRTAGGHRRIALRDAIRYIRQAGLPVVKPELLGIPDLAAAPALPEDHAAANTALMAAITMGRAEMARGIAASMYVSGRSVADICDGPLKGALHQVGDLWRHGAEGIFIEHRAVEITVECLHVLRGLLPPPPRRAPLALGGAMEGDPYLVPTLMVSVTLAAERWATINLGPELPVAAVTAAVKEHKPALVWLSCSVESAMEAQGAGTRRLATTLSHQGVHVIVGGRGWGPRAAEIPGVSAVAASMGEVAAFIKGLEAKVPG